MSAYIVPANAGIPITCASSPSDPNPGEFTFTFGMPIDNSKGDLLLSLQQCSFTYKIDNITRKDMNNIFVYQTPENVLAENDIVESILIPDGMYSINQFKAFIEQSLRATGHWADEKGTGVPTSPILISANAALGRVVISLKKGWKISMTGNACEYNGVSNPYSTMPDFLGFSKLDENGDPRHLHATEGDAGDYQLFEGDLLPDINRGRMAFNLHCNLIAGSGFSSGKANDVLATIIPNVGINETVIFNNQAPIRIPISTAYDRIQDISFRITDQYNRPVHISGDPTVVVLSLSRNPKDIRQ